MDKLLSLVVIIIVGALLFGGMLIMLSDKQVALNSSRAHLEFSRAQSSALVVSANAQANQSNALAFGIMMTSLVPWGILFTVSLLGLGVLGLCFMVVTRRSYPQYPPQIVYIPRPELSRREIWQLMSQPDSLTLEQSRDIVAVSRRD